MRVSFNVTVCNREGYKPSSFSPGWQSIEERFQITKTSIESLLFFAKSSKDIVHEITILDDGTDYQPSLDWMKSLKCNVIHFPSVGSAEMMNHYLKGTGCDIIFHFEDDQIYFNPFRKNYIEDCKNILLNDKLGIQVICFKSGHGGPGESSPEYNPRDYTTGNDKHKSFYVIPYIGNAQHVMLRENYEKFFPLIGNRGSCETMMNQKNERELKFRQAELQEHYYVFHSHVINGTIPNQVSTTDLRKWGCGIQYGIKDMHEYLLNKKPITCEIYTDMNNKQSVLVDDYCYEN